MREIEHKDRFGNLIEVGDSILHSIHSEFLEGEIVKITPKALHMNSRTMVWECDQTTKKWTKRLSRGTVPRRYPIRRFQTYIWDLATSKSTLSENLEHIINLSKIKTNDKSN
jgi:hypothetical protein